MMHPAIYLVPATMLVVALAHLPYGYYTLLRLVVSGSAVLIAYELYSRKQASIWLFAFVFLAILFNPVIPVHLSRAMWAPLDLGASAFLIAHMLIDRDARKGD